MDKYWFDGITTSEWELHKKEGAPVNKFYGNTLKKLVYRQDKKPAEWEIWIGGGLVPEFYKKPLELNKEEFALKMSELGVREKILEEYFATEGGFREGD